MFLPLCASGGQFGYFAMFLVVWKLFSLNLGIEKRTFLDRRRKETERRSELARCLKDKRSSRSEEIEDQPSSTTNFNVSNL
jgi:hypothetical protein